MTKKHVTICTNCEKEYDPWDEGWDHLKSTGDFNERLDAMSVPKPFMRICDDCLIKSRITAGELDG